MASDAAPFWSQSPEQTLAALGASAQGLSDAEVLRRLIAGRSARLRPHQPSALQLVWAQLKSPLVLMLVFAGLIAAGVGEVTDASVILAIVVIGAALGFSQEYGATRAVARLRAIVDSKARVRRGGRELDVPVDNVVVGDVVLLDAGALVPGDCRVLSETDLHVDEAALTGETFPVEKSVASAAPDAAIAARSSALFLGTHVVSGTAEACVVAVGKHTELGHIARSLERPSEPCDLEKGVADFGIMIAKVTALLSIAILGLNVWLGRPMIDSFLYSLALAVGLVPELLPAVVSVNLSRGARRMAAAHVIVRRLSSIEDFGSIDVLCSDKTGTLTEGKVHLERAVGADGAARDDVRRAAVLNALFESGFTNAIDDALRREGVESAGVTKLDEAPYDFVRKRMSVLVDDNGVPTLLTKGAAAEVLSVCSQARRADGSTVPLAEERAQIDATLHALSRRGLRCLGVSLRTLQQRTARRDDEQDMTFLGLVAFADAPKEGIVETLAELRGLGVKLKMITGDNRDVAMTVAQQVGMEAPVLMTGADLRATSDLALARRADLTDVFAEVEPNQKERIVIALRRAGHVVGYLGDGINDAPALHAAHVGISVESAVDVAKEAAHVVLLQNNLRVLAEGVRLGRATLANTLKYIYITSSANFGNMLSMAAAGMFLPFLPLLPKQILLVNLLSDLPMMALAGDRVDPERLEGARRWNQHEIRRFMLIFGSVSSAFDIATFVMLRLLSSSDAAFQSAWFLESLLTELVIVFVMRTHRPFWRSRAAPLLLFLSLGTALAGLALLFVPGPFGLVAVEAPVLLALVGITTAYLMASELAKRWFFARELAAGRT